MADDPTILKNSQSRVFTIEGGSGPGASAVYQGRARALAAAQNGGAFTPIRGPSPKQYGAFETILKTRAQAALPTTSLEFREKRDVSEMLTLFQKRCDVDVQVHFGSCTDPTDFNSFEFVRILEGAGMENWATDDQGTFEAENVVQETLPFTGEELYDIRPLHDSQLASGLIVQEVVGIAICDGISCGNCGAPSDGASVIFTVQKAHGGSPGLPAEIVFTDDGGSTLGSTHVTTLLATKNPSDLTCVGTNLVVISGEDLSIHFASISDVLLSRESWTKTVIGLVATKLPTRIFSRGRTLTWIAAAGGYIYFSSDITAGVVAQTAGGVTTQDLADIHGVDDVNLIAVGGSNAVLVTSNGGSTWSSVTGPSVAVALTACWMRSIREWLVGDAAGNLWYTRDAGSTWTSKAFNGNGTGAVTAIVFATRSVGYMAHVVSAHGHILRTIDGGASWTRIPDGGNIGTLTDNAAINRLAVADSAPNNIKANLVHAVGLAVDASDGIWLKVA